VSKTKEANAGKSADLEIGSLYNSLTI